jgi:hypothetical protein
MRCDNASTTSSLSALPSAIITWGINPLRRLTRDFPFGFMFMVSEAVSCDFPTDQRFGKTIPARNGGFSEPPHGAVAVFRSRSAICHP